MTGRRWGLFLFVCVASCSIQFNRGKTSSDPRVVFGQSPIPTTTNTPADLVFGQPDFETALAGISTGSLTTPVSAIIYSGRVLISDTGNSRLVSFAIPN